MWLLPATWSPFRPPGAPGLLPPARELVLCALRMASMPPLHRHFACRPPNSWRSLGGSALEAPSSSLTSVLRLLALPPRPPLAPSLLPFALCYYSPLQLLRLLLLHLRAATAFCRSSSRPWEAPACYGHPTFPSTCSLQRLCSSASHPSWQLCPPARPAPCPPACQPSPLPCSLHWRKVGTKCLSTAACPALALCRCSVRRHETNLGNFVCDVLRGACHCDAVLINSGTLRSDAVHPAGQLTNRDLVSCGLLCGPVCVLA